MDKKTVMSTKICKEHDEEFFQNWFSLKKHTFISHIDTFYFFIIPDIDDWNKCERKQLLIDHLREKKKLSETIREAVPVFQKLYSGLEVKPYYGVQMFPFHFGLTDNFDVFICETVPNLNTPPIFVQIRSQSLWLNGVKQSFDNACDSVDAVLKEYGIKIKKVQENRIDYAFHTNYIQDAMNFFSERHIKEMQVSNFSCAEKRYYFYNEETHSDYMTMGRRKSKNVFFRAYNKTKEVIEQGYKQFFIAIWLDNGLINQFDEYVIRQAFAVNSYSAKDKYRCEFYLMHGKDEKIKNEISKKLADPDTPATWYTSTAKGLVPDITVISNIEIQTMRKFYSRLSIPPIYSEDYRSNFYSLYDQIAGIVNNILTKDTIRFVAYKGKYKDIDRIKRPFADWWRRLRASKPFEINEKWILDYYREYQNTLDIERNKALTINKMARTTAYTKYGEVSPDLDGTIYQHTAEFLELLNDNDIKRYERIFKKTIKTLKDRDS